MSTFSVLLFHFAILSAISNQFSTAVTELFGTRLPIVAGGLQWLANADYVAAAARSGIMGFITASSHATAGGLRDEIARCQDLVGNLPFGINVSMLPAPTPSERVLETFDVVMRAGAILEQLQRHNAHTRRICELYENQPFTLGKFSELMGRSPVDAIRSWGPELPALFVSTGTPEERRMAATNLASS